MRAANEGRASNKGLSIAGVVTGAIGAVIGACYLMLFFIVMLSQ
ncbi:putative lipoprotein [Actinomyces sp. oral taxon 175 str. F0384]|nr:putative lipoprotein [Actinomyces sp. oral taxon 175 str. F0384]